MPVAYLWSLAFLVAHLTSFCGDVLWHIPLQTSERPKTQAYTTKSMQRAFTLNRQTLDSVLNWIPEIVNETRVLSGCFCTSTYRWFNFFKEKSWTWWNLRSLAHVRRRACKATLGTMPSCFYLENAGVMWQCGLSRNLTALRRECTLSVL